MLPAELIEYAARLFGCEARDILDDKRHQRIHRARLALYLAFWLRAEMRGVQPTYKGVGRLVGGRDHSTVIHGLKRARALLEGDGDFARLVLQLTTAKELPAVEKSACNPDLQNVQVPPQQQKGAPMTSPEDIEAGLNAAFKRAGLTALAAYWDGNIVTVEDPATLHVYLKDDATSRIVRRLPGGYEVCERRGLALRRIKISTTFSGVVDALRADIFDRQEEAA